MNKKVVVITLFLTTVFAVGGVILQTHGQDGNISIGSFSDTNYDEGWSFSVSADATESGANASASPGIVNAASIMEAATESGIPVNLSGEASAYVTIYSGNDASPDTDAGAIYAKLTVTVETSEIEITNEDGTITTKETTVKTRTPDTQGRSKYKGGGMYDAKDSGVCGNFGPWSSFTDSTSYRYTQ